jgi:hypothetical protein
MRKLKAAAEMSSSVMAALMLLDLMRGRKLFPDDEARTYQPETFDELFTESELPRRRKR